MSSIQAAIGGLQAAADIAKTMIGMRDAALIQSKTIELQSAILAAQSSALTAQSEQFSLIDRIRDLEENVRRMEAWETEKTRYELTDLGDGQFAYALKEGTQPTEPSHNICANCYNRAEKSILQFESRNPGRHKVLVCHHCGAEIFMTGSRGPEHGPIQVITKRPR